MMKKRFTLWFGLCLLALTYSPRLDAQTTSNISDGKTEKYLPIGGNTWGHPSTTRGHKFIREHLIQGWNDPQHYFHTYFRLSKSGNLKVWIDVDATQASTLEVSIAEQSRQVQVTAGTKGLVLVGEFNGLQSGYQKIALATQQAGEMPLIKGYKLEGGILADEVNFVPSNEGNYFYWGRRGPSTHMTYTIPTDQDISYYYNEITVAEGNDVLGTYYMAIGFAEGYFGIQVNSPTERRVLFSVWSPFQTDNPEEIPDDQKIRMLRKGKEVYTGEFGNEGSGGQSYLRYPWKAGTTYSFLLKGEPQASGYTDYTAWFYAPEQGEWQLIASFSRPKTQTYLKRFHSFLENFNPEQGIYERTVDFSNQWVRDKNGQWYECVDGKFTIDQTGRMGYRKDYAGGVNAKGFYLRNMGFFNDFTPVDKVFQRKANGKQPAIDWSKLP